MSGTNEMQLNRSEYYDEVLVQVIPTVPALIYLKTEDILHLVLACLGVISFLIMSNSYKRVIAKWPWMSRISISVFVFLTLCSIVVLSVDSKGVGIVVWGATAICTPIYIKIRMMKAGKSSKDNRQDV